MFVRWKRYQMKIGKYDYEQTIGCERIPKPRYRLRCELLQSYRNDNGKPRSRTLAYLGSIEEKEMTRILSQSTFWYWVEKKLERVELSPEDGVKIRQQIEKRVPCPSYEAYLAAKDNYGLR